MVVRLAVVVACLLAIAGVAIARADGDHSAPPPAHAAPVLLGAYVSPAGKHWNESGVTALERQLGRGLAIDHRFKHWADPFPTSADAWDHAHGRMPMITWEPDTTSLDA